MLLRRISRHVKEQNWFAVAIDFVIVVIGVFIGLQVANWNEARQDAKDEKATIERLLQDFAAHEQNLVKRASRAEWLTLSSARLLEMVQSGDEPADREETKELIFRCLSTSFREAPPSSYTELLESGALSKLSNQALRESLVHFGQSIALWDYIEGEAQAQIDERSTFRQALTIRTNTEAFAAGDFSLHSTIGDYDWSRLLLAETAIATIMEHHWKQLDLHQGNLRATQAVLAVLRQVEPART